jgi:6-pyruvoyltetrahydropterin/6-carboxytetrahydropterin synthase
MCRSYLLSLTRSYHFCAAHRMWNESFPEEKNRALYGKCANDDGHGHNYLVEVTVTGERDAGTGMIMTRSELDAVVDPFIERLDHHNINAHLAAAGYPVSTSEALAATFWDWLQPHLGPRLHKIRIVETERNHFEYMGPRHA